MESSHIGRIDAVPSFLSVPPLSLRGPITGPNASDTRPHRQEKGNTDGD